MNELTKQELSDIMVCIETDIKRMKKVSVDYLPAEKVQSVIDSRLRLLNKVYKAAKAAID